MATQILMPALSPTMTEGKLAKWLKAQGDMVKPGDVIAEIETDKATMEVEAVDEGRLAQILVAEGTEVAVLRRFGELLAPGGRVLVGFHLQGGPETARRVTPTEFAAEVEAAGLAVDHRFGGYDLRPVDDQYAVWTLRAARGRGVVEQA